MAGAPTSPDAARSPSRWITPSEESDYRSTPDYSETLRFVERLGAAYPDRVRVETFGKSGEGRDLRLVIVSKDGIFDPERAHSAGKVVLLVQNCIHAGETDGKDASLALLRDLLAEEGGGGLPSRVVLAIIPIYNADGHERRSPFNRINQNGPEVMGWRANGTNLNLNRDYLKADAPETRAFLRLLRRWLPDFFIDNHVTDGADFQYDVTFSLDATPDVFPPTAAWVRDRVTPEIVRHVEAGGHAAFPGQVFLRDDSDPAQGLVAYENPPRFSTGRMILENRPGLLVEMHMLKDYRTRVAGNRLVLEAVIRRLEADADRLIRLNREADQAAALLGRGASEGGRFPLVVSGSGETTPVEFRGYEFTRFQSEVSGAMAVRYGTRPWNTKLPMETEYRVVVSVAPPAGYIVPPQWTRVIGVLEAQGVNLRPTTAPWTGTIGRYRLSGMERPPAPFEGRFPILRSSAVERAFGRFGRCELTTETATFPRGSVVAALDQRLSKVVLHWLEPEAPDSALRWGFFDSILEQKESGEAYVLEKLAREELDRDPVLRDEFEGRVRSDPAFAASPAARLDFFYQRSRWGLANRAGEYPVGRLGSLEGLPLD
jgi:hypothetical protein